ncbi:IS200/IS605 family element transposase accessory protein TnpB [Candidatus Micrarchaeota archaeon]|nr:IS200/IS605 family element transposase accessory protein TnpB [Candidatus Micrarchaeota archaeon]
MRLTNQVRIETDEEILDKLGYATNKLWNTANYLTRQKYEKDKTFLWYFDYCKQLKNNFWYKQLPSQTAQAILQKLDGSYRSWLKLRKSNEKAHIPGFRKKNSIFIIPVKYQQLQYIKEDSLLRMPLSKRFREENKIQNKFLFLKLLFPLKWNGKIKYVELFKRNNKWLASITVEITEPKRTESSKSMSIDLGIKNLATCFTPGKSIIYKGSEVLAVQRYFNKEIAKTDKTLSTQEKDRSKKLTILHSKKKKQTKHAIHSLSKSIIAFAKENNIGKILLGDIRNIRKDKHFNKNSSQKLHSWLFGQLTQQLEYKAELAGIQILKVSERGTSRTCSGCGIIRKANRKYRGLYVCNNCNLKINADINGAINIYKMYQGINEPVVAAMAQPVVVQLWNKHNWMRQNSSKGRNLAL